MSLVHVSHVQVAIFLDSIFAMYIASDGSTFQQVGIARYKRLVRAMRANSVHCREQLTLARRSFGSYFCNKLVNFRFKLPHL